MVKKKRPAVQGSVTQKKTDLFQAARGRCAKEGESELRRLKNGLEKIGKIKTPKLS